ncbi:sensor histidine kinase [Hymenobacter sp. B81]|uniref:sensor histidine kinase n=1 Tax=Hymenobacter sp. B81 TaxID=3344878 RepID=UPI0037DC4EF9
MKRRIRSIFWLMTLCILGINGFQGYWLWSTYQLTATQFGRTVREALAAVLQQQQLAYARQLLSSRDGQLGRVVFRQFDSEQPGANRIVVLPDAHGRADTLRVVRGRTRQLRFSARLDSPGPGRRGVPDTLARNLGRLLIRDWAGSRSPDLGRLSRAYRAELRLRQVETPFVLDTLTIAPVRGQVSLVQFADSSTRAGYPVQTPPLPLNPLRDLYVQAAFPAPTSYILRQMGGLLAGSVALLGLTTGCFLLMLSTILRQKKLSEVKNDFINNMTHELKTPLATASAAVEALQHFGALDDPQKTQTYLNISRTELQRLSELVEKVLNMAVEERQALELHPEPVQPAALVSELVARHQLKAPKPVRFEVDVPAADVARFDPVHVAGVLNNLIDNAIKYSREQVTIAIWGRQEAGGWHLTVRDDGLGIPRSYQEAIFDRFFRVPTGNLHPVKGFGLGLYYVRQVVERHGGRISVRSEPGQGSEFSLWLPK